MQNKTGNKIRLGVFVTAGIVLFIAGIYFIGQKQQLFNNTFRLSATFKDISGLQLGNNIRLAGINVGIIDVIEQVTDTTVRVDMLINGRSRKFIKKNAKAMIGSDGLMGNKLIIITARSGGAQMVSNNDTITTEAPINVDEIFRKVKVTSDNLADITDDLSAITNNIRQGKGTIGKLFFDSAFAMNLDKTIMNIKQGAGGFKKNMDAASHNFLLRGFMKKKDKKDKVDKKDKKDKK